MVFDYFLCEFVEGRSALFSGVGIVLLSAIPSKALFFMGYEGVRGISDKLGSPKMRPVFDFAAGMCSEILSSLIYVPEEVIKSRMMLGRITNRIFSFILLLGHWTVDNSGYKTSFHAAREIFRLEGVRGFYHGYCSCILTDCVNSGFQVLFYDAMRRKWLKYRQGEAKQVSVFVVFVCYLVFGGSRFSSNICSNVCINF